MALPWLRLFDAAIGMTELARRVSRWPPPGEEQQLGPGVATGPLEARLAGVVVAALKEAFDRDTRRLELEREQLDAERQRAERALRLELRRQAGDREIGRLRLMSGVAVTSWFGVLFFSTRLVEGPAIARAFYGIGWLLLLAALGAASTAQSRVARALARIGDADLGLDPPSSGTAGTLAPWLIVAGLAVVALAVLMAQ